ncbi:CsgG/HfaB family protein [Acinetobacter sp. MD2(2019)]|uniref:CsgG/HfaB family protein n=1 Tax=Acinetobacter sp. MD2(2019) TaxID=2605273 RepID=UPI002D1F6EC7|nr:CsgG/HfaB family protein [Acinetobacter sp. MD2(2019)]MEB3753547.1 penicillin-binding protein activator LpoB [Acinetobacter sp. MD2(2019)]
MKKMIFTLALLLGSATHAIAGVKEVVKDATGSGPTQQQAVAEALLIAVQSVNGTGVSSRVDYEETVSMSIGRNQWNYSSKTSPVFSVDTSGTGSVSRFQVLSLTGSKDHYRAHVRAYVNKFESAVNDQHLKRIAILPFRLTSRTENAENVSEELADLVGTYMTQSGQLSVLDRQYLAEMQYENDVLNWDGAPQELARIGQKVGVDYLVVGKITQLSAASSSSMYGLNKDAQQVRLTWRVIEANTSKVVAAGTLNKTISAFSGQNLVTGASNNATDALAQGVYQDIMAGLKLKSRTSATQAAVDTSPGYDMTPGSSDKPIKW